MREIKSDYQITNKLERYDERHEFQSTMEDFRYIWEPGSQYYAARTGHYSYTVVEKKEGSSVYHHGLIMECDDDVYEAIIQRLIDKNHVVDLGEWSDDECRNCAIKGKMRDEIITCPECGADTCRYQCRTGGLSYSCDSCNTGVATSYFPPCYTDRGSYGLYPELAADESLKVVAAVAKLFHVRYNQLLIDIRAGKKIRYRGRVREIVEAMRASDHIGIAYRIAPPLPYSLLALCMEEEII